MPSKFLGVFEKQIDGSYVRLNPREMQHREYWSRIHEHGRLAIEVVKAAYCLKLAKSEADCESEARKFLAAVDALHEAANKAAEMLEIERTVGR